MTQPDRLFGGITQEHTALPSPTCCVAIDAEEDFDWAKPIRTTGFSTECMRRVSDLRPILAAYRLRPTYLVTWPVLHDADVVSLLRHQYDRGECDVGVQLHPWVTPPFDSDKGQTSYLGNLDPAVEERKLVGLIAKFRDAFGRPPECFRAGRYGLSPSTAGLLERHGFTVDTSLAPRTDVRDQGGPDYAAYECAPFWFGAERPLLELPLCRSVIGWAGRLAPWLYQATATPTMTKLHVPAVLSRLRCVERVTLSPEGNDPAAMRRLLRHRRRLGQSIFSLSFHSSSLAPGRNPYVRSKADLHHFYDRLSAILDTIATSGYRFATLAEIPGLLRDARA